MLYICPSVACDPGQKVDGRWTDVFEVCKPHVDDHLLSFNDLHIMMSCLGAKEKDMVMEMSTSIEDFIR